MKTTSASLFSETSFFVKPTPMPPVYNLCDGVPRVNATPSYSTITQTITSYNSTLLTTITEDFSVPPPACSVPPDLCINVQEAYVDTKAQVAPLCDPPPGIELPEGGFAMDQIYSVCWMAGGPVRLLYWPVSTVGGLCAHNISTIPATQTAHGPNTIAWGDTILTSPTVYLSFETLYAIVSDTPYWNSSYTSTLGSPLANVIVPEAPNAISTLCDMDLYVYVDVGQSLPYVDQATPLDYAKLQQPVRLSDYECAVGESNGTIFDNYDPTILFPTELVTMQAAWKSCSAGRSDW